MKMSKLKRQAGILSKECGLSHSKALELASKLNGFKNYRQAQKEIENASESLEGEGAILHLCDWNSQDRYYQTDEKVLGKFAELLKAGIANGTEQEAWDWFFAQVDYDDEEDPAKPIKALSNPGVLDIEGCFFLDYSNIKESLDGWEEEEGVGFLVSPQTFNRQMKLTTIMAKRQIRRLTEDKIRQLTEGKPGPGERKPHPAQMAFPRRPKPDVGGPKVEGERSLYLVPVTFETSGHIEVEAGSPEEAIVLAKEKWDGPDCIGYRTFDVDFAFGDDPDTVELGGEAD